MRSAPMPEELNMPYHYCPQCLRLSPVAGDILDDLMCLVCGGSIDFEVGGRKVIFTKREADLRNLIWKTR